MLLVLQQMLQQFLRGNFVQLYGKLGKRYFVSLQVVDNLSDKDVHYNRKEVPCKYFMSAPPQRLFVSS